MLTLKYIEPNGREIIVETKSVWTEPDSSKPITQPLVYADNGDGREPHCFGGYGSVYVMNDAGRTVAKYYLGEEPGAVANAA
jgi:hypothetical protein